MRRRRALLRVLVVVLAVPVGLVLALPWLAGPGLRLGLRQAGLGEAVAFDDLAVHPSWAELVGLRIGDGPDLALERVRLAYEPGGLARGRLKEARLEGLVLRGRLDETGRLHLDALDRLLGAGGGGDGGATPVFPVPERVELVSGRIELATPLGALVLPVSGEARRAGGGRAAVRLSIADGALLVPDAGGGNAAEEVALRADLEVAGEVAVRAMPRTDAVTATGTLELAAEDLRVPGLDARVTGGGPIELAFAGDRLTALFAGFTLELAEPGPALAPLAELAPPPLTLTLGTAAAPLEVVVGGLLGSSPRETGLTLRGPAALAGGAAGPRLTAEVGVALAFGANVGAPFRLEPDSALSLAATDLSWHRLILPRAALTIEARGTPGHDLHAALDLDLAAEGEPIPRLGLDGAWLRLPADLDLAQGQLTLRPRAGARVGAAAFRWRDSVRGGPIELPLDEAVGPLLTALLRRGVVPVEPRYRLALLPAPFTAEVLTDGAAPLAVRGTTPRIDLDLEHPATGRLLLAGAAVEVPAYQLALAEAGGELKLAGGGLAADAAVPLRVGAIRHTGEPAWFRPLALRGVLRPEGGGRLGFQAELTGAEGRLDVDLSGRHDLAAGAGRAEVRMAPLEFAPGEGGLQPAELSPLLARAVSDVAGWLDLDGTVAWGPGRPKSDLALLAHDLSLTVGPARVERINAAVQLDSLAPPSTPPGQLLGVALLDVGLPLVDGVVEFRLDPNGTVAVDQARWRWAGGEVGTGAFAYRPGQPLGLTLQARSLDVAQLLDQVQLGGLEGTGRLSGALPVRIEDGVAVIDHGELRAQGPGWLRYRPEEPPAALQAGGEGVNLMLQALENFRYEALRITLDGRTDSEMQVGLHLSGANPRLYDGYPVEFNLNLEGELGAVLQAGIQGYSLPERIAERMQRLRR